MKKALAITPSDSTVMAGCSLLDHTIALPAYCPWKVYIWLCLF